MDDPRFDDPRFDDPRLNDPTAPDRIFRKIRQLAETLDEIDAWIGAGRASRPQGPVGVDALLHSVLSRRVSLESIPGHLAAGT